MEARFLRENRGLLIYMVRRYARLCRLDRAVSEEDLAQTGALALLQARETYDPARGRSWGAWACWHLKTAFEGALGYRRGRFRQAHSGACSLDVSAEPARAEAETLKDRLEDPTLPDACEGLLRRERRQALQRALAGLESGERRVLKLTCLDGLSCSAAARALGIDAGRARRLREQAGRRLMRDKPLRALWDLDERTRFYAHKSVAAFNRDWTSTTEAAALWRLEQRGRWGEPNEEWGTRE